MISTEIKQENVQKISLKIPRWVELIFKIYGGFILGATIFSAVIFIASSIISAPKILISLSFIKLYSLYIFLILIGWGSYYLKKYIIPLFILSFINGLIAIFIIKLEINWIMYFSQLFNLILFFISYYYRQYFIGSYKNYLVYIVFIFTILLSYILK